MFDKSKGSKRCIDNVESCPLADEDEVAARTSEFQLLQREQKKSLHEYHVNQRKRSRLHMRDDILEIFWSTYEEEAWKRLNDVNTFAVEAITSVNKNENHFDVITSVSSFLGKSYWCLECMKGYDAKEKHRCSKVCKCCFTEGCLGITLKAPWRECGTCHRMFAGTDCYINHCRPNIDGQSVCQKFYKCQKCNKVISHQKKEARGSHVWRKHVLEL